MYKHIFPIVSFKQFNILIHILKNSFVFMDDTYFKLPSQNLFFPFYEFLLCI